MNPRKPATYSHEEIVRAFYTISGAATDAAVTIANPGVEGSTDLPEPGEGFEYVVLSMHVSLDVDCDIKLSRKTSSTVLDMWGTHSMPAGFAKVPFPDHPTDPTRAGLPLGDNQTLVVTVGSGAAGRIDFFMRKVAAK